MLLPCYHTHLLLCQSILSTSPALFPLLLLAHLFLGNQSSNAQSLIALSTKWSAMTLPFTVILVMYIMSYSADNIFHLAILLDK